MKVRTFCLDNDTIDMLEKQSEKMHLNHSAYIRFLLIQNNRRDAKSENASECL
jgi:hypothetical protein